MLPTVDNLFFAGRKPSIPLPLPSTYLSPFDLRRPPGGILLRRWLRHEPFLLPEIEGPAGRMGVMEMLKWIVGEFFVR